MKHTTISSLCIGRASKRGRGIGSSFRRRVVFEKRETKETQMDITDKEKIIEEGPRSFAHFF